MTRPAACRSARPPGSACLLWATCAAAATSRSRPAGQVDRIRESRRSSRPTLMPCGPTMACDESFRLHVVGPEGWCAGQRAFAEPARPAGAADAHGLVVGLGRAAAGDAFRRVPALLPAPPAPPGGLRGDLFRARRVGGPSAPGP